MGAIIVAQYCAGKNCTEGSGLESEVEFFREHTAVAMDGYEKRKMA
jgi:hypothetical protein